MREFREQIARFPESGSPVAVTRRGETFGVYVPTPRKPVRSADQAELCAAADRLAAALSDVDADQIVAEFKKAGRAGRLRLAEMIVLDARMLIRAVLGRRVRQILETYAVRSVRFCAPEVAYADPKRARCRIAGWSASGLRASTGLLIRCSHCDPKRSLPAVQSSQITARRFFLYLRRAA